MSGPSSLQHALDRLRRERPAPLPADFSTGLLEQLLSLPPAAGRLRPTDALAMAAAVILTAVAISLPNRPSDNNPPPLSEFGGTSILFAAP